MKKNKTVANRIIRFIISAIAAVFFTMEKNMGTADRFIRLIIAVIAAVFYFMGIITGTLGIVLMILAVIFVLTSFISFCPLYLPFGINTGEPKK